MDLNDVAGIRLVNQKIAESKFTSAREVVGWLGAMQAQDYHMAKWAIGIRMKDATDQMIEESINRAEIVRTHVMRPTWHFTLAEDIRWMQQLTAQHVKASMKSNQAKLGVDEKLFKRTNTIIAKLLENNNYLTRAEVVTELKKKKITLDNLQATHVMFDAELNAIVCNGPMRGKQFTYALMDERIAPTKSLTRDEALSKLATKYFTSHGPATVQDFAWWSGLPAGEAKKALEIAKTNLIAEKIDDKTFWVSRNSNSPIQSPFQVFLPAYDEFMISYTDRSASIHSKFSELAMVGNGIFRPIIVADGQIIGIWLRTIKKDHVAITTKFFSSKQKMKKTEIELLTRSFGKFLNLKLKV